MGVQGITPFLQKLCPGLLKLLPNRLQEIQGKRIVIDATLITQRLHFSQGYGVFPHVLGWYRIAKELNDNGISAICVFDGETRNSAKARETNRRRELRALAATRGTIESDRFQRLNKLKSTAEHFQGFDMDAKRFVAERLSLSQEGGAIHQQTAPLSGDQIPLPHKQKPSKQVPLQDIPPPKPPPPVDPPPTTEPVKEEVPLQEIPPLKPTPLPVDSSLTTELPKEVPISSLQEIPPPIPVSPTTEPPKEVPNSSLQEIPPPLPVSPTPEPPEQEPISPLQEIPSPLPVSPTTEPQKEVPISPLPISPTTEPPEQVPISPLLEIPKQPPLPVDPSLTTADPPLSLDQTLRVFESLSLDFKANIAKLASVAPSEPLLLPIDEEDQAYRVMTKAQNQLTTDEGKVWGKIASSMSMYAKPSVTSTAPLEFPISTINDIHTLADKSFLMSTSFLRRTNTPTDQTYQESKDILQAMGIPCIDAGEATEAEALASAIVHEGLADFVATEDTDVLVYEVPMMRNITNRMDPLVIVSGAEVRTELDLDRDAFIDFALLLGTDFSQRISGVGPKRAYKFIKDHGSIERIIELETKYEPKLSREDYLAEVELGRLVYKTLPTVPLKELKKKIKKKKDDKKVTKLLQRHGLFREMGDACAADNYQVLLDGNYYRDSPTS